MRIDRHSPVLRTCRKHHSPLSSCEKLRFSALAHVSNDDSMKLFAPFKLLCIMLLGKFSRSFVRPSTTRSHRGIGIARFSTTTNMETVTDDLKRTLVQLISTTERGVRDTNRAQIFQVIDDLSKSSANFDTTDMLGEWELLYSDGTNTYTH